MKADLITGFLGAGKTTFLKYYTRWLTSQGIRVGILVNDHGAVNAANLDGGSSTTMYYNGEYLRTSVTFYYSNSSWRIPTSVLVR